MVPGQKGSLHFNLNTMNANPYKVTGKLIANVLNLETHIILRTHIKKTYNNNKNRQFNNFW